MVTFLMNLKDICPSQLYINSLKLQKIMEWFKPEDPSSYEAIPVKQLGNKLIFTDGHTRAYKAYKNGVDKIKVYYDEDDLDWNAYQICVDWCTLENIKWIGDLEDRVIDNDSFQTLWIRRCENMHKELSKNKDFSLETTICDIGTVKDEELKFAVIVSKLNNKFVYVRHKERNTWEVPGGHRELNEAIDTTAERELKEETGAIKFNIRPICDYLCDYSIEEKKTDSSYGRLYYAEIEKLGKLPDFEIEEVKLFDNMPDALTYPEIQPILIDKVLKEI